MNAFVRAKLDFAVFILRLSILISSILIKFVLHVKAFFYASFDPSTQARSPNQIVFRNN